MKNRIFGFLLAACLAVSLLPMLAWAEEGQTPTPQAETSGTCGENVSWKLDDTGLLTISGTGAMADYGFIDSGWNMAPLHSNRSQVKSVVIEAGVTDIGNYAFNDCNNLTSVSIPNSVVSIGESAFYGCAKLESVTIPGNVKEIQTAAFSHNSALTSVTIGEGVKTIGNSAFEQCTALESVTIPQSVTYIGYTAFYYCSSLKVVICEGKQAPASGGSIFTGANDDLVIWIPVRAEGYGEWGYKIKIDKIPVTITGVSPATGLVYNGSQYDGYTGTPIITDSAGNQITEEVSITTHYTSKDGTYKEDYPSADAGTYTLTLSVSEADPVYTGSSAPITYTIDKATPDIGEVIVYWPESINQYMDLRTFSLGYTNYAVQGDLRLNADQTLTVGTKEYAWTFTPYPQCEKNYHSISGKISLTVLPDVPERIEILSPPSKINYTYGEAFDFSGMAVSAVYLSNQRVDHWWENSPDISAVASPSTLTVGTQTVNITVNYLEKQAQYSLAVTVAPKEVTSPTIELAYDTHAYTGQALEPAVTVKDGDTVIPSSEYTVNYENNTAIGMATVTITDAEGGNYTVSNSSATFTITKAEQAALTITGQPTDTICYGKKFTLSISGGSGDGVVSWSVTSGPATVGSDGAVEITGVGDVTITATKAGDTNYQAATATYTFTDQKATPDVGDVSLVAGQTIYPNTALDTIQLKRTQDSILGKLALDAGQTLTVGKANYNWTFTPTDTSNYNAVSGTIELTVEKGALSKINVTTAPTKTAYTYGDAFDKTGMVVTATYASTLTEDVTNKVTFGALKAGDTTVTLSYTEGSETRTCTVDITVAKAALTITADSHTVTLGDPVPELTYVVTGLVNGDTYTNPTITTTADTSQEGSYPVTISGGTLSNADCYDVTYQQGDLMVTTHQWAESWNNNSTHHWHECLETNCTITDNSAKSGYGAHRDNGQGLCVDCGYTLKAETQEPAKPQKPQKPQNPRPWHQDKHDREEKREYDSDTPQTGDTTRNGLWLTLAALGLLGLTASIAAKKRYRTQ